MDPFLGVSATLRNSSLQDLLLLGNDTIQTPISAYRVREQLAGNEQTCNFHCKNDDNERQVIRTRGERIELRHPVNVLRLYPSLPDLREEMIDETK